ncbi:hypothetical protein [Enterococcus plantarum]|nr:hypothetical protein [Enterococcus plantarum]MBO0422164.1 hypothetical protein [Enterococcus plantarum]
MTYKETAMSFLTRIGGKGNYLLRRLYQSIDFLLVAHYVSKKSERKE